MAICVTFRKYLHTLETFFIKNITSQSAGTIVNTAILQKAFKPGVYLVKTTQMPLRLHVNTLVCVYLTAINKMGKNYFCTIHNFSITVILQYNYVTCWIFVEFLKKHTSRIHFPLHSSPLHFKTIETSGDYISEPLRINLKILL